MSRFASVVGLAISNADARDLLERQASTDPLTGIANRRTFRQRLAEEFAWLMPETDEHGARVAAERVREAIETTLFEEIGQVTLSAGVCSTERARGADTLVRDADRALYWAKDSGRNMTMVYADETPGQAAARSAALGLRTSNLIRARSTAAVSRWRRHPHGCPGVTDRCSKLLKRTPRCADTRRNVCTQDHPSR